MLRCTVKFCGGCNPRFDRGAVYQAVCSSLADVAVFGYPEEGAHYDVLLIVRGCTGCPYLYEDIDADRRFIITAADQAETVVRDIKNICRKAEEDDKDEESKHHHR